MLDKLTEILKTYKEDPNLVVTPETSFEDLGLDSLDTVELIMTVEDEFSVSIEPSEELKTIGDLMKVIEAAQ